MFALGKALYAVASSFLNRVRMHFRALWLPSPRNSAESIEIYGLRRKNYTLRREYILLGRLKKDNDENLLLDLDDEQISPYENVSKISNRKTLSTHIIGAR